jgi:lipopolysaccharide export system protein LptA
MKQKSIAIVALLAITMFAAVFATSSSAFAQTSEPDSKVKIDATTSGSSTSANCGLINSGNMAGVNCGVASPIS